MKGKRLSNGANLARSVAACILICATSAPWISAAAQESIGKTLFVRNCSACHQIDGKGIPGVFPALAGNLFVQGNEAEVASVLLTGRNGMPNFSKHLTDRDLAVIVGYIRNAWGNQGAEIAPERVAALRSELHAANFDPAWQNIRH